MKRIPCCGLRLTRFQHRLANDTPLGQRAAPPWITRGRPARSSSREESMMNDSTSVRRRPRPAWLLIQRGAATIIATASLILLATAWRRQPVIRRRLIGCRGVNELSLSGRVLGLHALQGRTKLPRPRRQWTASQGQRSAIPASARPSTRPPSKPAGTGYRRAGRSNYKNTNVCRTATVHRLWCSRC